MTNDQLAERSGIPLGTLSKILAGMSDSPKLSNIIAICSALDCSVEYVVSGVPENTNNYTLDGEEIRMIESYPGSLDDLNLGSDAELLEDYRGRSLLVFSSYWAIDFICRRNPGLELKEIVVALRLDLDEIRRIVGILEFPEYFAFGFCHVVYLSCRIGHNTQNTP